MSLRFRTSLIDWLPGWLTGTTRDGRPWEPEDSSRWALYKSRIGDYMDRLILKTPLGTLRIHHLLREDRGEDPHDHPFDFTSLIVHGGYEEEFYLDPAHRLDAKLRRWFKAGDINRRKAADAHRIVRVLPWTITLVVSGPKVRREPGTSWGFWTPGGWIYWREYHDGRAAR